MVSIIVYAVVLVLCIWISFFMGASIAMNGRKSLNPIKRIGEIKEEKKEEKRLKEIKEEEDKEAQELQIMLENIENYDGTGANQKDLPR